MNRTFSLARVLALGVAGLTALVACQGEGPAAPEPVDALAQALCSVDQQCANGTQISCSSSGSACTSGADGGGLYVECDGTRTYCSGGGGAPACVCGATKQASGSGGGATCGAAYNQAKQHAIAHSACPTRICSSSFKVKECSPVSSDRDDGFEADVIISYTCKEPANCQ